MKYYDLIYYCDGFPEIGMGHVFRGIDITNAFKEQNPNTRVAIQGTYHEKSIDFIKEQLNAGIQILDATSHSQAAVAIVDTMFYPGELRIDHQFFNDVKEKSSSVIFLWDAIEYEVPSQVDAVINHLPYCKIQGNHDFERYTGLDYAPMPKEFYDNTHYNLDRGYFLSVIGGTTEPLAVEPLLDYVENLDIALEKMVILSPSFDTSSVDILKNKYPRIQFKQNVPSMAEFLTNSSVIITTYGSTTFKAMASKVPTFTVAFQEFQDHYGTELEKTGYSTNLGRFENLDVSKLSLLTDKAFKKEMHIKLKSKFVTPGINNIIDIISKKISEYKN